MRIITLTTDFGTSDWFVGTMKGVILAIHPRANIVDLTHEIPAGGIRAGAFALAASCKYFPKQTIHVAVVDPGVGGPRKAIAVQTADYTFIGPDNGVLSFALAKENIKAIHQLTNEKLFLKPVSQTFHGRDVFAPVAAHLSKGLPLHRVGAKSNDFTRLPWPEPRRSGAALAGEIIHIDRFGNAITNVGRSHVTELDCSNCEILVRQKRLCALASFYDAVKPGSPVAVLGSSGFLEIAVNGSSAAGCYKLAVGDAIIVRPSRRHSQSSSS